MVLPLRTLASSNGCKTRQSDWCAHCQDMNTSHHHLYVFTGGRLSLESISILLCSVSSAFTVKPQLSKKHGRQQQDFDITTSAHSPVSSWKTILDDRKKRLAIEPFPMHPPRSEIVSRNHYSKISTPLRHCLKLSILQKRLI